jgi:peptide/nickel transport system permease protein
MAAYLMMISVMFVVINLLVDILYAFIDPRLRVSAK